jgi:biotin carboxyl carrier protein
VKFEVRSSERSRIIEILEGPDGLQAAWDGQSVHLELIPLVGDRYLLHYEGRRFEVDLYTAADRIRVVLGAEVHTVEVRQHLPFARRSSTTQAGETIASPMPGLVVAVHVAAGDTIEENQPVVTLEAMKMQMEVRAPHPGIVRRLHTRPGQEVTGGQALMEVEG